MVNLNTSKAPLRSDDWIPRTAQVFLQEHFIQIVLEEDKCVRHARLETEPIDKLQKCS